jgi:hypothetical protein
LNKTIEITVDNKGAVIVETKGFIGPSCKDASRFLELALGEKVADQPTAELYQSQAAEQQLKSGGGT